MSNTTNTWTLVKPSRDDQRIWVRNHTGHIYIADHSGDTGGDDDYTAAPVSNGTPDHTDDGPLRIDAGKLDGMGITMTLYDGNLQRASIPVFVERDDDRKAFAMISEEGAFFLSNLLAISMAIKSPLGYYTLKPFDAHKPQTTK